MTLINNWTNSTSTLSITSNAFVLAIGSDSYVMTTGAQGNSPYYSHDGGKTWTASVLNDTDWAANATSCLATVSSDGHIYLINRSISKLYVSSDNGVTYSVASSGSQYTCLVCVGSTLFANLGTGTTLYKSVDHGVSFIQVVTPDATATSISVAANASYLFLCALHASTNLANLYRSQDDGATWTQVLTSYSLGYVGAIFHTASSTYLGVYDVTSSSILVLKSEDDFNTSTALSTASILPAPTTMGGADSSSDIYFASMYSPGVICTSADSGATLSNEAPDSNMPVTLAVGATSIVVITTSSATGTNLYSGVLLGGKVLPSTPVISPATTTVTAGPITVTITVATPDAAIYYTTDGSEPTVLSTLYLAPFDLTYSLPIALTVKAIAVVESDISAIAAQTYRIGNQVASPTITGVAKEFVNVAITISDADTGVSIYYTLDGTVPTVSSMLYTGTFLVFDAINTIKAIAIKAGYFDSDVTTTTINASIDASDYPTLGPYLTGNNCNPVATSTRKFTVGTTVYVDMYSTTSFLGDGAPIYYTLDGTSPTIASTKYTEPLEITASCVIKAAAIKGVRSPLVGNVTTITYDFTTGTLTKPTAYTLSHEYIGLTTGAVTEYTNTVSQDSTDADAAAFIPDYNNGVGALAISLYSIGNVTPGYVYLCDPITGALFKRVAAVTPGATGGIYAMSYAADTGLLYVAADNCHIYSIDINNGNVTELNATLPATIHYYLVYCNADRCLYGYCNDGNAPHPLVKYNTITNVFSTVATSSDYAVDFCDPDTGILYGHSSITAGLVTLDRETGAVTQIPIATTTVYDRLLQDTASKNVYAVTYPTYKTVNIYKIDLSALTETLTFSPTITTAYREIVIASAAAMPSPLFSVAAGAYASTQVVSITCAKTSAYIYYTLDGSTPAAASALYIAPISVSSSCTLKAIAILDNISSPITAASYTISSNVPDPRIIPNGGVATNSLGIQITCTRIDAHIYYTLDGSTPSAASTLFTTTITITSTTTVKAIAIASGSSDSSVVSAQFIIKVFPPTFSLPAGSYAPKVSIGLACSTTGSTIRYTTDGSLPTETSTLYITPIVISTTVNIKAVAYANGKVASDVVSSLYTVAHDMLFCAAWSGSVIRSDGMRVWGGQPGFIYRVDTSTSTVVPLPLSTARYWRDMTCSVKNKVLYACTSSQSDLGDSGLIYKIDSATGAETPVTSKAHYWRGIVYDDITDTLYGCDIVDTNQGTGGIYSINVTTGEEILISGITTALWSCITLDSDTGMLYIGIDMTSWWGGTNTKWGTTLTGVYSLKVSTGVMTCIDEGNRGYTHITLNKNNGLLYLTAVGILMSMTTHGGYNLVLEATDPSIGYSSITKMLITADMRVVNSSFYNIITYIDTYAYQKAEVVIAPSSGEYFQACVSISLVEAPKPDIEPGIYTTTKQVQLSCETEGATIHYTLDGSEPSVNSPVYAGPITIG